MKKALELRNVQEFCDQKETVISLRQKDPNLGHHAPTKGIDSKTAAASLFLAMRELTNKTDGAILGAGVKNRLRCKNEEGGYDLIAVHQGGFNYVMEDLQKTKFLIYCRRFPETEVYIVRSKDFINEVEFGGSISISDTERTRQRGFYDKKVRPTDKTEEFFRFNDLGTEAILGVYEWEIREHKIE